MSSQKESGPYGVNFPSSQKQHGNDENNVHIYNIILKEINKLLCSFKGDVFMIFDSSFINLCMQYFINKSIFSDRCSL